VSYGGNGTAVTATPDLHYHFVSWSDGVLTPTRTESNVTANVTVTANFALDTYTLTYIAGAGGTITGTATQTVAYGGSGTAVTATPDLNYHFVSWSDGVLTPSRTETNVTANVTVTANFALDTYTLTYTAGVGGTISGVATQAVSHGGNGTPVTAVANPGYHFVAWGDGVLTATRTETNVTANVTVTANFAANPVVPPIAHLTATQNPTGNPAGATTGITLSWDATSNTVEVWRVGFGHYPEYSDAGGTEPTAPTTHPPGGSWVLTGVTSPGGIDLVPDRDFYYFVAYQKDSYDTWSVASAMTSGTLNYHLGDFTNGTTLGVGDNRVNTADVSLLGHHYGISGGDVAEFAYLDVGPTSTLFVNGLPSTDNQIDFEDLVLVAINYGAVSGPMVNVKPAAAPAGSGADELALEAPERASMGATVTARLVLRGAGDLMALATKLKWDPTVVEPVGQVAGEWLTQQSGVAFSAAPGAVDAAVLQPRGMSGEGELATVTFRVLSAGDPKIRILSADGRDALNRKVAVTSTVRPITPTVTQLALSKPNPFRQTATVSFSLAKGGPMEVTLFSVDGRRVRTLVKGVQEPGEYTLVWDGRDDHGSPVSAGVYFLHLTTAQGRFTRTMTYLR
jgi:hypothetical protein